jgi:hypothetical protein
MQCANCDNVLPEGAKFCTNCGTKVGLQCPNCGQGMPAEAKFCMECGTNLAQGTPPPAQATPAAQGGGVSDSVVHGGLDQSKTAQGGSVSDSVVHGGLDQSQNTNIQTSSDIRTTDVNQSRQIGDNSADNSTNIGGIEMSGGEINIGTTTNINTDLTLDDLPHVASGIPLTFFGQSEAPESGQMDIVARRLPGDFGSRSRLTDISERYCGSAGQYRYDREGKLGEYGYIIRPRFPGKTLQERLVAMRERGMKMPEAAAMAILGDVIEQLEGLPQQCHGSLSPGNICTAMKKGDRPKATGLLDVGMHEIRRAIAAESPTFVEEVSKRDSLYEFTDILGTPQGDVAALGLIFLQLLGAGNMPEIKQGRRPSFPGGPPSDACLNLLCSAVNLDFANVRQLYDARRRSG